MKAKYLNMRSNAKNIVAHNLIALLLSLRTYLE